MIIIEVPKAISTRIDKNPVKKIAIFLLLAPAPS